MRKLTSLEVSLLKTIETNTSFIELERITNFSGDKVIITYLFGQEYQQKL